MKKKLSLPIIMGILVFLLVGCGPVTQTENAIAAIGTVTIDSLDEIVNAEALYDALGDKQAKVENAETLAAARSEYNRLTQLIADAEQALSAITNVTPDSSDAIHAAWSAYEALEAEGLTNQVSGMLQKIRDAEDDFAAQTGLISIYEASVDAIGTVTLDSKDAITAAENNLLLLQEEGLGAYISTEKLSAAQARYQELFVQSRYCEIEALYQEELYEEAIAAVWALYDLYPDHQYAYDAFVIEAKANIGLAQKAYDDMLLETALNHLEEAKICGADLDEYKNLSEKIQKKIESSRPSNGKTLSNSLGGSYCKLTIKNGSRDACIKLESVENPEKYHLFYVRADSETTISVPGGTYNFKYTTGDTWYGPTEMFGSSASYSSSDEPIEFTISYSGNYVNYTTMTITLYAIWGGNFDTDPLTADEF